MHFAFLHSSKAMKLSTEDGSSQRCTAVSFISIASSGYFLRQTESWFVPSTPSSSLHPWIPNRYLPHMHTGWVSVWASLGQSEILGISLVQVWTPRMSCILNQLNYIKLKVRSPPRFNSKTRCGQHEKNPGEVLEHWLWKQMHWTRSASYSCRCTQTTNKYCFKSRS